MARCAFSEKSLQRKPRYTPDGTLFLELIALTYWPIATKVLPFVTHAWKERSVNVREKPLNGNRGTAEKAHRSPSKVFLITDRFEPNVRRL
jgi:hypothetical protein